jgi:hypothetical protein
MALLAFIGAFFVCLLGIVCGHIALSQIKRTGEKGRGYALAGLIVGYAGAAAAIITVGLLIAAVFAGITKMTPDESPSTSSSSSPSAEQTGGCSVVRTPTATIRSTLSSLIADIDANPGTASAVLDSAAARFEAETIGVTDQGLITRIDAVLGEMKYMSSGLTDFTNTPVDDRDPADLQDDFRYLKKAVDALAAYCS